MFTRPLVFATAFMSFFSVVIALFKDIPDIEGEESDHSLRFRHVFHYLQMAYAVAVLVGATSPFIWSKVISVVCHVLLATTLWTRAKSVDLSSKTEITSSHMFIWK
ncbi:hypothetical protein YC2023_106000 [Brassica napus]